MNVWRLMVHHLPDRVEQAADWSRRKGVIAVGWGDTGDLRKCRFGDEQELTRLLARYPERSTSNCVHGGRSLWRLYSTMQIGDLVILSTNRRELTMRVTGDYYFVGDEYPPYYEHRRKAEAVPIDPNRLWQRSGGIAPGENIRRTLIRCARGLTETEYNALLR